MARMAANERCSISKMVNLCLRGRKQRDDFIPEQNAELLKGNPPVKPHKMYVNRGQRDQIEIDGYRSSKLRTCVTYFVCVLTLGLLRLVFHWVPHWLLRVTCVPCAIGDAEYVLLIEYYGGKHKTYHVKRLKTLKGADVLNNNAEGVKVPATLSIHFGGGAFKEIEKLLYFNYKKVTYIWDEQKGEFVKLRGLDHEVTRESFNQMRGLTANEQLMRRMVYGRNDIEVEETPIFTLLFLEVLNPFYIFQIFSFCLWFYDGYYYYATAILIMSGFGIMMTVIQTRKNQRNLKSTVHSSDVVHVLRSSTAHAQLSDGPLEMEVMSTELLVPGDVIEIPPHGCILYCDALLLTGNCILNESMLTGESVPVTKTPFPDVPYLVYDPKQHARHTLFCGTQVIQTRYFGNEKVLAVIIRTGFSTAKGELVRSILYPPPADFRFERDSYRFVMLLGVIAGLGFLYTVVTKMMKNISPGELMVDALDLITIVVPPALPAAMTVGSFYAQRRLKRNQIYCISPRTINVAGSIDCVCFDKTGTLTEEGLDLLSVVPIEHTTFLPPINDVDHMPYNTLFFGLVTCHSLTIIDKQITGDPLDLKMFESTRWTIEEYDIADNAKFNMIFPTVFKPPKSRRTNNVEEDGVEGVVGDGVDDIDLQIGIIREFPFTSSSQRMGVIVRKLGAQHFEFYCKGSPEMLLNYVDPATVPDNFADTLESYTQEGYRVIALAHKELRMSYAKVQRAQKETLEHEMNLLGLIVLENRLKADTTPCITALNEACIRVNMVTGDNILTAVSVARDCGIVAHNQCVITVNCDASEPPQLFYTLTSTKTKGGGDAGAATLPVDYSLLSNSASIQSLETVESQTTTTGAAVAGGKVTRPSTMFNDYRLALSGKVWHVLKDHYPELMARVVARGSIYARMSPDQKQQLIQELQGLGYCVAMCGDGANDCGALKAAHVGISLSEAESSVASPFTSKIPNVTCVLNIIREGRAALVTSFGIFKYMASYSLCQFISVMILYGIDSNLTDIEFLYIDLFIISVFAFFFGKTAAYAGKLVKETPMSSLMSVSPVLSLVLHLLLVVAFQLGALAHLRAQPWYHPYQHNFAHDDDYGCHENYTIFTISSFQYIILAIVFSKGKPYRRTIFTNYGFIVSAIALTLFTIYLTLRPAEYLRAQFELELPPDWHFQLDLLLFALANLLASIFVETIIIDYLSFKRLRFRFHNADKSKRRYLAVERALSNDAKWPVLSDLRAPISPLTPVSHCTAEIVVERGKFEGNHVLNGLYEAGGKAKGEVESESGSEHYHSLDSVSTASPDRCFTPKEMMNGFGSGGGCEGEGRGGVGVEMNCLESR